MLGSFNTNTKQQGQDTLRHLLNLTYKNINTLIMSDTEEQYLNPALTIKYRKSQKHKLKE